MDVFLAESGGLWGAYFKPKRERETMDLYLAGISGSIQNAVIEDAKMDLFLAGTEARSAHMYEDTKEENMDIYLADTSMVNYAMGRERKTNLFTGIKILQSFYYCNEFTEKIILPSVSKFMLDSGAFTFFQTGKNIDWNEYVERYADFINRNRIDLFFELDIDSLIGYDNVKKLRGRLESLTGKPCIPVWHKSRGKEDFIQMCKDYDYVSIGGIVSKEIPSKEWSYFPWFINKAHEHGAKIHGLGFTSLGGLSKYHFDSVDSTSWTSGNRFGTMYRFNGKTMELHKRPDGMRLADSRTVAVHNFKEWVKFQKWAESHL